MARQRGVDDPKRRRQQPGDRRRSQAARDDRDRARVLAQLADRAPDGLVLSHHSTHASVLRDDGEHFALIHPRTHKLFGLAAGDRVWTDRGATDAERVIVGRAERRNEVRRRRGEEDRWGHVIAANVDRMAITAALYEPPLRTGALDRYLVLASVLGIEPLLVITKCDQVEDDDLAWEFVEPYVALGVPVVRTSATSGAGIEALRAELRGRVTVFAGHSGVGKSSLCQALGLTDAPEAGDMSYAFGRVRGRHTTSVARLLRLPGGGWVVDTPGVRAIGLVDLRPEDARVHFPEFEPFAEQCKYADCLHLPDDPGCAVVAAVEDDAISIVRYDGYSSLVQALLEEDGRPVGGAAGD